VHFHPTDPYRQVASPLHSLDPRVKVLGAVLFILATSLTPEGAWRVFGLLAVLLIGVAVLSRLGPLFAVRRAWIALPFALAALGTLFTIAGRPVAILPGLHWVVTDAGVIRFASILARSLLAVQAAILLTGTTRFDDILWALSALNLPATLLAVMGFLYRYLFVLGDEALRILRARAARSPRLPGTRPRPVSWRARVAGMMVGSLFTRALDRSERVYAAMRARGYAGQVRAYTRFHMRAVDWAALLACGLVPLMALWISRSG
jgi:cobalt/nickel transport system permease protein